MLKYIFSALLSAILMRSTTFKTKYNNFKNNCCSHRGSFYIIYFKVNKIIDNMICFVTYN